MTDCLICGDELYSDNFNGEDYICLNCFDSNREIFDKDVR